MYDSKFTHTYVYLIWYRYIYACNHICIFEPKYLLISTQQTTFTLKQTCGTYVRIKNAYRNQQIFTQKYIRKADDEVEVENKSRKPY